ncbi:MAG: carboxypeptidase regulatory-like domain-containing protein [Gemmatimonadaceae bacterium]|nr:carboxypeptidase regulatory-like domain-containing protein [Gemmatimonadaceae bacterium]
MTRKCLSIPMRALALVLVAGGTPVMSADAQSIRGRLFASDSSHGTRGAIVQLVDQASGTVVARTIARSEGVFVLSAPRAGTYSLRTLRIGYRPGSFGPLEVPASGLADLALTLENVPVTLAAVHVTGRNSCTLASDQASGGDVLSVWAEARTNLLATLVARAESGIVVTTTMYERVTAPRTGRLVRQVVTQQTGASERPFRSPLAPESYSTLGYRDDDATDAVYRAPDADVMLSDSFAATHCLHLADEVIGSANEVGVSFEPVRSAPRLRPDGHPFVDVRGTLWLDRASSVLRRAEFRYTGVEPLVADGGAGGTLTFLPLPGGVTVIGSWAITVPRVEVTRRPGSASRQEQRVADLWTFGGELALARLGDSILWRAPDATIRGTVRTGATGAAAPRASVRLAGTSYRTTTDSLGRFELQRVLPGRYEVLSRSDLAERLGLEEGEAGAVDLRTTRWAELAINVGPDAEAIRVRCGGAEGSGLLYGDVRGPDGAPTANVVVQASWHEVAGTAALGLDAQMVRAAVRADSLGRFHICRVPREKLVDIMVVSDSTGTTRLARLTTRIPKDGVTAFVAIPWAKAMASRLRIRGHVATLTGRPVRNATVDVLGRDETQTDSLGRFTLDVPAGESFVVRARHLGHQPVVKPFASSSDVPPDGVRDVAIIMEPIAVQLGANVTTADSTMSFVNDIGGFERRRRTGHGTFITQGDIETRRPLSFADLIGRVPGIKVLEPVGTARVMRGRDSFLDTSCDNGMQLFVDGVHIDNSMSLKSLNVTSLRGVELYHGLAETPVELRTRQAKCGTIAVWTK